MSFKLKNNTPAQMHVTLGQVHLKSHHVGEQITTKSVLDHEDITQKVLES